MRQRDNPGPANNTDHGACIGPGAATCGACTLMLVRTAYRRAPWFRLVREPLRIAMVILGKWHRIDSRQYRTYTDGCRGCLRFTKTGLKEKSALFRRLNNLVNPLFDRMLEAIVTREEVTAAKEYAAGATQRPPADPTAQEEATPR
ncbi:MAG: nitroreductase [Chloroflexi bacterium]|nr:nitroreductase [Chloroflexota bacterium]